MHQNLIHNIFLSDIWTKWICPNMSLHVKWCFLCSVNWWQVRQQVRHCRTLAQLSFLWHDKSHLLFPSAGCSLTTTSINTSAAELTYFSRGNIYYSLKTGLGWIKVLKGHTAFTPLLIKLKSLRHFNYKFKKQRGFIAGGVCPFLALMVGGIFLNIDSPSKWGKKAVSGYIHIGGFLANIRAAVHVPKDIPAPAL